jgi:hypothetical protein
MDFRNIIQKMRQIDPTTPGQDLEHYSTLAESTGIALGAKEVVTEAADMATNIKKSTKAALKKSGMKTEASKPDFLDMDKDGDKKEPMKKAAKDAKKKKEPVKEAEQVIKAEKKQKLPSKKSILMMCGKGMSKSAICKEYSDCDQEKLKEMIESCMEEYKKKKNESVSFVDMDGEIVEAQSAKQKAAFQKMLDKKKGKTSDDKEKDMDEGAYGKKKKKAVKESVEPKMSFVEMMKTVKESGGQQAIDPLDDILWNWANRVAKSKVEESAKQEIFAAMVYERNGGRFEMYDVVEKGLNESKECNCGPDCDCKGNCGDDCNCGPDCGK